MDPTSKQSWHDSSSEDELRPMDEALDSLKNLKKGVRDLEAAMTLYSEHESTDPYDTKTHPFREQFFNTYQGSNLKFSALNGTDQAKQLINKR